MSHITSLYARVGESYREATGKMIIAVARINVAARMRRGATLSSPQAVRRYPAIRFGTKDNEISAVIHTDNRHRVIECQELFRESIDGASLHPREVVKEALHRNAAACILMHKHPSGVAEPSQAD